jgi:HNH endonuclease
MAEARTIGNIPRFEAVAARSARSYLRKPDAMGPSVAVRPARLPRAPGSPTLSDARTGVQPQPLRHPRQRRGLGAAFDRWKPLVIERDGARCRLRHPGCTIVATTADHIIPRSQGGRTTLENLRASCCHCNSARGDGRNSEATRSSVTSVTRAAGQTGRGIESLARLAPARTGAVEPDRLSAPEVVAYLRSLSSL